MGDWETETGRRTREYTWLGTDCGVWLLFLDGQHIAQYNCKMPSLTLSGEESLLGSFAFIN